MTRSDCLLLFPVVCAGYAAIRILIWELEDIIDEY